MIRWAVNRQVDVYHALGSFRIAETKSNTRGPYLIAKRTQENVHSLKCLVIDADVSRPGDGKANAFSDRRKALAWLINFTNATQLPLPNLAVNSGYGYHWYWLYEQPLPVDQWHPLADALCAAMRAHGWLGDTAPTRDASRILRPPGSVNMKSGTPVPVTVLPNLIAADYPNQQLIQALAPWTSAARPRAATGTGGASVTQLGPRPGHMPPPGNGPGLNAAARSAMPRREYSFQRIANHCSQVGASLAQRGEHDDYPVWTAMISLTVFCADGANFVHPISDAYPKYDPAKVDAKRILTETEITTKRIGAPLCKTLDSLRPNVCLHCPHWQKINSPVTLGVEDGDLPDGYRRAGWGVYHAIEKLHGRNGDSEWRRLVIGDVYGPVLTEVAVGGHQLTFTYDLSGVTKVVSARDTEMGQAPSILTLFARQGISLDSTNAGAFGVFIVAWINKLKQQRAQRGEALKPFGWSFDPNGSRLGAAIAGTHYRRDGVEEAVPGGDPKINALYQPAGSLANWRQAAALFEGVGNRPDTQALIACSFASPLLALCSDVRGMSLNFWSPASGVGKTSGIKVGQAVWGNYSMLQSMNDTPNAVMRSLSVPRFMVRYWDELRVSKAWHNQWCEMIYVIPQGRERARMQQDTTLRETGEWEALVVFASNRAYADELLRDNKGTDSGVLRLLEIEMGKHQQNFSAAAGPIIKLTETNYGHAGREFIKWVVQNVPAVQSVMTKLLANMTARLSMRQEERFYVTAIATILAGASIAKQLKLFDFDLVGIRSVMEDAFNASRIARSNTTFIRRSGEFDIEQLIGEMLNDMSDWRLWTKEFATQLTKSVTVLAAPRGQEVRVHISDQQDTIRVSRAHLHEWLQQRNLPSRSIVEQMKLKHGVTESRQIMAAGTPFRSGQIWVVDIPWGQHGGSGGSTSSHGNDGE